MSSTGNSGVSQRNVGGRSPGRGSRGSPGKSPGKAFKSRKDLAKQAYLSHGKKPGFTTQYGYHIVMGVFVFTCLAAVVFVFSQKKIDTKTTPVIDAKTIERWNADAQRYSYTFRQGENDFFDGWTLEEAKATMQNIFYRDNIQSNRLRLCKNDAEDGTIIPRSYNFRTEHAACAAPIQDQGNCSSNYALTAASTISDRFCMKAHAVKKNYKRLALNPQTYTSCDNK
jgi:hypothetical protein